MLVVMQAHASEEQVRAVCQKIEKLGYRAHAMPGAQRTAIGITGNKGEVEQGTLEEMPGVQEVIQVYKPRTSPYSFQGLGEEGLRIMADIRQQYGMKIITEAIDNESLDLVEEYG